jgi:hypothetical protein
VAIYLDASVLRGSINGPEMSSVRAIAKAAGQALVIPSVALDEATANQRRAIEGAIGNLREAVEKARSEFPVQDLSLPDAGDIARGWRLEWLTIASVAALRPEHAVEGLRREIERIRPAREEGRDKKGYGGRDTAIWLSVVDDHVSRSEVGYLVSGDGNDFGRNDGKGLHPDLASELASYGPKHDLVFVRSTAELIERLATQVDSELSLHELAMVPKIGDSVSRKVMSGFRSIEPMIQSAFGQPVRWTGVAQRVEDAELLDITRQRVYRLPDQREVAVIDSQWSVMSEVTLSGPKEVVEAGFERGTGTVEASVEIWATRQLGGELEAEVSHVRQILPRLPQIDLV